MLPRTQSSSKDMLHGRNPHREAYDFPALIVTCPALADFVRPSGHGRQTIDFSDPRAVKTLNQALLRHFYGIVGWDIPEGYLCPPIPGRADYVHHAADLLAKVAGGEVPRGKRVRSLDVGVGASCIYPIIGQHDYGWSFVGTDIDKTALRNAEKILAKNPQVQPQVELRLQRAPAQILSGVITPEERFDLTLCNPPFHASREEAEAGTRRKVRNLHGRDTPDRPSNFGGRQHELWCRGGELGFVTRMIAESAAFGQHCLWFTTLLSNRDHVNAVERALRTAGAKDMSMIEMAQGQKKSRLMAWTFLTVADRKRWAAERFFSAET